MAFNMQWRKSLVFFWTFIFVRTPQHHSFTLRFVDSSTGNQCDVETATLRLNCSRFKESYNVYHCIPLYNVSLLVEFCHDRGQGFAEKANCMVLKNRHLSKSPCTHFTNGCPNAPSFRIRSPTSVQINRQNRCYVADHNCLYIRICVLNKNATSSVKAIGNNTVSLETTTTWTLKAGVINDSPEKNIAVMVLTAMLCVSIGLVILWIRRMRRGRKRKKDEGVAERSRRDRDLYNKDLDLLFDFLSQKFYLKDIYTVSTSLEETRIPETANMYRNPSEGFFNIFHNWRCKNSNIDHKSKLRKLFKSMERRDLIKEMENFSVEHYHYKGIVINPTERINRVDFIEISKNLATRYIHLLRFLGMRQCDIEQLEVDHQSIKEKIYHGLLSVQRERPSITRQCICNALCYAEHPDVIDVLNFNWNIGGNVSTKEEDTNIEPKETEVMVNEPQVYESTVEAGSRCLDLPSTPEVINTSVKVEEPSPLIGDTPMNEDKQNESEDLHLRTGDDPMNEMHSYLEDEEFLDRYQKYLEEGSIEVCPISQIIIVGEHGVGKTTLLYRLQGRSRKEIESIRSTRGVECHTEQHSFIITKNQLEMNLKGVSSLAVDPGLVNTLSEDKDRQSGNNKETKHDRETEGGTESKHDKESHSDEEPKHDEQTERNNEAKHDKQIEPNNEPTHDKQMERDKEQMHDEQREVNTEPKHDKQIVRDKEQKHEHKEFNTETKHDKQKENDEEQKHYEQAEDDTELKETECETKSFIVMLEEELEERNLKLRFGNKDDVVLDVLDFAGQGEYYASHQTYIRKDAIFILLVDTSKDVNNRLEQQEKKGNLSIQKAVDKNLSLCDRPGVAFHCWSPKDYFYYWLKTIQIHGGVSERIIFVGTHEDQKRKDFDFDHLLNDAITENLITEKYSKPIITNLGRYDEVTEDALSKIKNEICIHIKKCTRENQPAKWVKFASRFDMIKRKFHIGKIEDVLQMIDHFDPEMSDTEVADMLHFFHRTGKIIFFNIDRLQDTVILDIPWFINCFKHIIADRKHVEEDCSIVDVKDQKMLRIFHEKGILEIGLYRKLLTQKGISEQYQITLGEYQSKLGMMFYIRNYKMNDGSNIDGWYVPSINTQEFKPSIERYGSDESSQILCIKFKDYLPYDFFGRLVVTCVNSGHWHPYDFRLCKAGADMCYCDSDNNSKQIYLFTSRRIVTAQCIGKHSKKYGQEVKQEILNVVRQLVQFYARSNEYEIGFLCRKKEGYTEDSVNHFVSKRYKYCQGCHGTCDWVDTESFWKEERNRENTISTRKLDPSQIAYKVYSHVVTRVSETAAKTRILQGISSKLEWAWIDHLAFIGQELNDLHRKSDAGKKETALRNINKDLKKIACGLDKNTGFKDLRKEIFFLWSQTTGFFEKIQGIPVVSLKQKETHGTETTLEAKTDVPILHHLWLRKIQSNRQYKILRPGDEEGEKYKFQEYRDNLLMTIKNFDVQDKGNYFVLVVTETGASVCGETIQSFAGQETIDELKTFLRKEKTTVSHARGILVGCAEAGKTTLLKRLRGQSQNIGEETESTRGLEVHEHLFRVKDGILEVADDDSPLKTFIRINAADLKPSKSVDISDLDKTRGKLGHKNSDRDSEKVYFTEEDNSKDVQLSSSAKDTEVVHRRNENKERDVELSTSPTENREENTVEITTGAFFSEAQAKLKEEIFQKILSEKENLPTVSILDFAGQLAYYACHQIYVTPKAFFILVLDMTKNFEDVSKEKDNLEGSIFSLWTYRDFLKYWISSIKTFGGKKAPVFLVVTHTEGKSTDEIEKYFAEFWNAVPDEDRDWLSESLNDREYAVGLKTLNDNTKEILESMKKSIVELFTDENNTKVELPSSWALMEQLLYEGAWKILTLSEIWKLNASLPHEYQIKCDEEMSKFLKCFHDSGLLLNFEEVELREHVILDIQWFANAVSKIIADENHINKDCQTKLIREWKSFNKTGELKDKVINALWKDEPSYSKHKNEILPYMEKLQMLVPLNVLEAVSEGGMSWYVPCMNKKQFKADFFEDKWECSSILCYRFTSFAMFVFYRLIAYCISSLRWSVAIDEDNEGSPCLYQTAAVFDHKEHTVVVGICKDDIQLQVLRIKPLTIDKEVSNEIGHSIEKAIEKLTETFIDTKIFLRGFKCQNIICNEKDLSFTLSSELSKIKAKEIQCTCQLREKHVINVQMTQGFWEKREANDSRTSVASGQTLDGRSRFAKLCMATNDVLNKAYRDILGSEILPSDIENRVNLLSNKKLKSLNLNANQEDLLIKAKTSGYEEFDISLTYKLIRNICSTIPKTTKGKWGEEPAAGEVTVGDDIERIRLIRNSLTAHVSSASTPQTEFDDTWSTMSDICQRLETYTGKKYLDSLNSIYKLTLNEEGEDAIKAIIEKFVKDRHEQHELLKTVVSNVQELKSQIRTLKQN